MGSKEFMVGAYRGNEVFILRRTKDSLFATSYLTTIDRKIGDVFLIFVNRDTAFTKTVDTLYSDIKQNHSYQQYSKGVLTGDDFSLMFYVKDKVQIFNRKKASQDQLMKANFIASRLRIYSIMPSSGLNNRKKYLNIKNWNELLKYLKSGTVDSVSK
jgi:hypothetical protein